MMHARARRPFFADVRFLVGVILVAVSIAGVWMIVSTSRHTTPVLQATRTVVPGETIDSADLQVVEVGLGAATDDYLAPHDLQPGAMAMRTLAKGELVPLSAIGTAQDARTTTVVVSSTAIPAGAKPGSTVEVWHAPVGDEQGAFDEPRILVDAAVIETVAEAEGMLSSGRTDVELIIDRTAVGDVLAAISRGDSISIVPTGVGS